MGRNFLYSLAERINQELQEKFCHMFQSETAIDYACDHDRVLREHFPQVARSHREEVLPPELEEIFQPRQMDLDEPEGDETETDSTNLVGTREARAFLATSQSGASTAHRVGRRSAPRRCETRSNTVCSQGTAVSNV